MQAVGGLRKQIRRTIWLEALGIGVIGLVLGSGLGAVKGAADKLAGEMKQLAAAVFGSSPDDIELVESQARIKGNPEAAALLYARVLVGRDRAALVTGVSVTPDSPPTSW